MDAAGAGTPGTPSGEAIHHVPSGAAKDVHEMTNIQGLISSLAPDALAALQERGPDQQLDRDMLDAIDGAAGGPGEGRGYYIVRGSLTPLESRQYFLRDDVVAAIWAPLSPEGIARAGA